MRNAISDNIAMIQRHKLFHQLREVLADCFPDRGMAKLLANDGGLRLAQIDLSGAPIVFWQNILDEADRDGKVESLLGLVSAQAPARADLVDLARAYQQSKDTRGRAPERSRAPAVSATRREPTREHDVSISNSEPKPGCAPGQPDVNSALKKEREEFKLLSGTEKLSSLRPAVETTILNMNFTLVPQEQWIMTHVYLGGGVRHPTYWKVDGGTLVIAYRLGSEEKIDQQYWRWLGWPDQFYLHQSARQLISSDQSLAARDIKHIRTIGLLVTLGRVGPSVKAQLLHNLRSSKCGSYYYWPQAKPNSRPRRRGTDKPTSTELILIDRITSVHDLIAMLNTAFEEAATSQAAVFLG